MTTPSTGTIYALLDPRTNNVRYVGQTTKPIEIRLAGHLASPSPLVKAWITELAIEGHLPQIVPLRECVPVAGLDAAEKDEIKAHADRGDILNVVGNAPGNARRRKVTQAEQKRRQAEVEAMDRAWWQASWRKVADQIREATGGPISPADIPVRDIPASVWSIYEAYQEADRYISSTRAVYLLVPTGGVRVDPASTPDAEEVDRARRRRIAAEEALKRYFHAYCAAFAAVDDGERYGVDGGVFGRGSDAYKTEFTDSTQMARYLSLIPWAARALDPWVALAEQAGMDPASDEFRDWVSEDQATRDAIGLCRDNVRLGRLRQAWDTDIAAHALAVGAAHIPGFVIPDLVMSPLGKALEELARDRQATREMCQLLQSLNPKALDAVYGADELAAADEALGLPPGTSARVVRQVYGDDTRDPGKRTTKLLQRNSGDFGTVTLPDYLSWSGPHVAAYRVTAAVFYAAGLLPDADKVDGDALVDQVKATWQPTPRGLEYLLEVEEMFKAA